MGDFFSVGALRPCVFVGAHPVGDWLALVGCMQSPTGVGSYEQPFRPFASVGAHPVGDGLAMAVCVQSPTGVGSYKQPPGLFIRRSPPRGRLACHGGMRAIAHRVGSYKQPPRPFAFVTTTSTS
jgi:hypothetical protein